MSVTDEIERIGSKVSVTLRLSVTVSPENAELPVLMRLIA